MRAFHLSKYPVAILMLLSITLSLVPLVANAQLEQLSAACRGSLSFTDNRIAIRDGAALNASCSAAERDAIRTALQAQAETQQAAADRANGRNTAACDWYNGFTFDGCIWHPLVASIGAALVSLTAWLLGLCGNLFNYLVYHTIIQFGDQQNGFLTTQLLDGINTVWKSFRDLANILIIGLFTFIAISIILGLKEFGQKKMIARVLIVAVLINFSLLFTKIIIDGSNFLAYQFYKASSLGPLVVPGSSLQNFNLANAAQQAPQYANDGIAGRFIRFMGVSSISNTFDTLKEGAYQSKSGWMALLHGLFSATLLLAAALVLLYGSFLIVARAIWVVILMLTSSLAFASYLVPQASTEALGKKIGWTAWWSSLIRSALFAPLLMMFLWATLMLSEALQPKGGTLGALINDPTNSANLRSLFSYIIILGMLYASFKLSSMFSHSIAGFNFAGIATAALPVLALRGAAPILRNTLGRNAAANSARLGSQIETEAVRQARLRPEERDNSRLIHLIHDKAKADKTSKRTFDAMNTGIGQRVGKSLGLPGVLADKTKTNAADSIKSSAEHAAKEAVEAAVSKSTASEAIKEEMRNQQQDRRALFEDQKNTNQQVVDAARAAAEAAKARENLPERSSNATQLLATETLDATRRKDAITRELREGTITPEQHRQQMDEQENRIRNAQQQLQTIQDRIQEIDSAHRGREVQTAQRLVDQANRELKELDKIIDRRAQDISNASSDVAQSVAADLTRNWFTRTLHNATSIDLNGVVADKARSIVKKKIKAKPVKERQQADREILEDANEADAGGGGGGGGAAPAAGGGEPAH